MSDVLEGRGRDNVLELAVVIVVGSLLCRSQTRVHWITQPVCVCECVCVCMRERMERERERGRERERVGKPKGDSVCVCVCVRGGGGGVGFLCEDAEFRVSLCLISGEADGL